MRHRRAKDLPLEYPEPGITRQILGHESDLMLVKVTFEKGAAGAVHKHPHQQVTYIESGTFEVEIDGHKKVLEAGDSFVVPSNLSHGVVCLKDGVLIDGFSPRRDGFLE